MILRSVLFLLLFAPAVGAESMELIGPSGTRQLSAAEIATLPQTILKVQDHGSEVTFDGPELRHLLAMVDAPSGETLRGTALTGYVLVEARDGYRVIYALAELDPAFREDRVILARLRDGKPLTESESPYRIVPEREKKHGRAVRKVIRLTVGLASPPQTSASSE
jgi:hypothetical protein